MELTGDGLKDRLSEEAVLPSVEPGISLEEFHKLVLGNSQDLGCSV